MKHVVRMLVALLLVGGIGFGVWYFAFRDKPNEVVFKEMTAAINHLDEVEIEYNFKDGETTKQKEVVSYDKIIEEFYNVSTSKNIASNPSEAESARQNITEKIVELYTYDTYSINSIHYYYSLTATAEKVKGRDKRDLVKKIEAFNNAVDTVVATAQDSLNLYNVKQVSIDSENNELTNKDAVLLENIILKQKAQADLFFELRDYVNTYVFGTIVPDYKSAMYNIYNNELNDLCVKAKITRTTIVNNETSYAETKMDTTLMMDMFLRAYELETMNYIDENAVEFLNSYNKLNGNIAKYLQLSYNKKDANGTDMVDSQGNKLVCNRSHFVESYEAVTDGNYAGLSSESGINVEIIEDVYNVLSYIMYA